MTWRCAACVAVVVGCGGQVTLAPSAEPSAESGTPAARDLDIDVREPVSIRAKPPSPSALVWPVLAPIPDNGPGLAVLRRRIDRRRRSAQADVLRFAGLLLARANKLDGAKDADAERATKLRIEARGALRKHSKQNKRNTAVNVGALHAYAEARTGKHERALRILATLQKRGALSPFAVATEAVTRASSATAEVPESLLTAVLPGDAGPALPYARAWLRLRRGDLRGAFADMGKAAGAWGAALPAGVEREISLLAAAARIPAAEVHRILGQRGPDARERLSQNLGLSYQRLGEYKLAAELHGADTAGEGAAAAGWMRRRSDLAYQLGDPQTAAASLIRATEMAATCSESCADLAGSLNRRALDMARFFHTVYATTQDPRYFEPARSLYIRLQATTGNTEVDQLVRDLVRYKIGADPGSGVHSKDVLLPFVSARADVIKGCYTLQMMRNPELVGVLEMRWDIDASGQVKGAASNPPVGAEGLAAVAACALEHSKRWIYPGRVVPGQTRFTVRFELSRDVTR